MAIKHVFIDSCAYRNLGFDTFSHKKGIVVKGNWLDIPLRYAPYTNKLNKLKKLFKLFGQA